MSTNNGKGGKVVSKAEVSKWVQSPRKKTFLKRYFQPGSTHVLGDRTGRYTHTVGYSRQMSSHLKIICCITVKHITKFYFSQSSWPSSLFTVVPCGLWDLLSFLWRWQESSPCLFMFSSGDQLFSSCDKLSSCGDKLSSCGDKLSSSGDQLFSSRDYSMKPNALAHPIHNCDLHICTSAGHTPHVQSKTKKSFIFAINKHLHDVVKPSCVKSKKSEKE